MHINSTNKQYTRSHAVLLHYMQHHVHAAMLWTSTATAAGHSTCSTLPKLPGHAVSMHHVCVHGSYTYRPPGMNMNTSAPHHASAKHAMQQSLT